MKKFVILSLALFLTTSAWAARGPKSPAEIRAQYVTRIETCEAILQEFMLRPETQIPAYVLEQARALVIVNQFKAGFILGVKEGYGIIMVKRPDGSWSVPAFIDAAEASLGFQIGATSVETVYVITDDETPRLLYNQRFNVGVDAKAVAGPRVAETENLHRPIIAAPVLVYSKGSGLYAGATVKAGHLARDDKANREFYNTTFSLPEILYSDWITPPPEVRPLMDYVARIAP